MPIKIRLRRMGRKKQPHYRIVVADIDSPRDGRFIETLGYYKPLSHPARLVLDLDRVDYWEGKGAQPSTTVSNLVKKARKGGDDTVAIGEVDQETEKQARLEALATRRRAEAEAAAEADKEIMAEAAKAKAKAEKAKAKAEKAEEVEEAAPEAEAAEEVAPEAEKVEEAAPEAEAAEEAAPEAEGPADEEKSE
jgi:small subunit ribosomal protein S16